MTHFLSMNGIEKSALKKRLKTRHVTLSLPKGDTNTCDMVRQAHHDTISKLALTGAIILGILLPLSLLAASPPPAGGGGAAGGGGGSVSSPAAGGAGSSSSAAGQGGGKTYFLKKIDLLEPLPVGGASAVVAGTNWPFSALNVYMHGVFPWVVGVTTGLAVLMIIVGGIQIILSGGNEGEMGKGRDRIKETLIGLGILLFSAVILNMLNAYFYRLL